MNSKMQAIILLASAALAAAVAPSLHAKDKARGTKLLAGYTVVMVSPFITESSAQTKDFPQGEEKMLKKSLLFELRAQNRFEEVIELEGPDNTAPAEDAATTTGKRRMILTGTVIGYSKGSSTARFIMWPLPVAPTTVKVRFVFRDAENGKEVFQTDLQGTYNAIGKLGLADQQESLAASKGGVIRALLKEIDKRR